MNMTKNLTSEKIAEVIANLQEPKVRASNQYSTGIREIFRARKEQKSLGKVCQTLSDIEELEDLIGEISLGDNYLLSSKEANQEKFFRRKKKNGGKRSNKKEQQRRRAVHFAKIATIIPHSGRGRNPGRKPGRGPGGFGRGRSGRRFPPFGHGLRPNGQVAEHFPETPLHVRMQHFIDTYRPPPHSTPKDILLHFRTAFHDKFPGDFALCDEWWSKYRMHYLKTHPPESDPDDDVAELLKNTPVRVINCDEDIGASSLNTSDDSNNESSSESSDSSVDDTFEEGEFSSTLPLDSEDKSGLSTLLSSLNGISSVFSQEDGDVEYWVSHLENIVILGYNISRATTFTDIVFSVAGYCKMISNRSIIGDVLRCIDEALAEQKPEETLPNSWDFSTMPDKWDLFKSNPIFIKMSYLISAAMSLSICEIKNITWSPFGLKLVALQAAQEQLEAVDVIDALVKTFAWMAETGYQVIQEGSLAPMLYADNKMRKFNTECDYVLAHSDGILAGNGPISVQDFEFKVDNILREVCHLKSLKTTGPTAIWLQQRYSQLVDIKFKIVAKYRNTSIRESPFGMGLTGPSGVGKSTLAKLVMKIALCAMGYDYDPRRIMTKDMFDKYDSTFTSDILGMFLDDIGNGKPDFTITSPTDIIIKFFNNMAAQAVKAELNAKGVVFIDFKVGVMTSNYEDYQVNRFTDKPEAALRRFWHTRVQIKDKYCLPGSVSLNADHPDLTGPSVSLCHDVWKLTIQEVHIFNGIGGEDRYIFRNVWAQLDGEKFECKNLDLKTYLRVVAQMAKNHKRVQASVVARSEEFDAIPMCSQCSLPEPMCDCVKPHAFENIQDVFVDAGKKAVMKSIRGWFSPIELFNSMIGYKPISKLATKCLENEISDWIDRKSVPLAMTYTPSFVFNSNIFQRIVATWQHSAAMYDLRRHLQIASLCTLGTIVYGMFAPREVGRWAPLGLCTYVSTLCCFSHYQVRLGLYKSAYVERRDALPTHVQTLRDRTVPKGVLAIASILVGVKVFKWWNDQRKKNIEPASSSLDPDKLKTSPGWFGFMMDRLGVSVGTTESSRKAIPEHLISTFQKSNLHWADFERADGSQTRCNIFFPRKGVAWFPKHIFYSEANMGLEPTPHLTCTVTRHDGPGGFFKFKVSLAQCSMLDHLDMVCCFVPNCPDMRTKLKFLPLTRPKGSSICSFLVHNGSFIDVDRVSVKHGEAAHKYCSFYGGSYSSPLTRVGACMGLLVLEQKDPVIVGFHIGGSNKSSYGVMQTVTREDGDLLIEQLSKLPGVFLSAEAGDIPEKQFGRDVLKSTDIHPHCMANHLRQQDFIEVLGSTNLRTSQTSLVQPSILSTSVETICGVLNQWGPPKLKPNWRAYNATLEHVVNPSDMFDPQLLLRARCDWLGPLLPLLDKFSKTELVRPLTDQEAILGRDGVRFLDALPMNTGMGFPVFGPKKRHFTEIRDGQTLVDRLPEPDVLFEKERLLACYRRGERGYPICTATLKDEPTKLSSEKVRVFQAAPVAMSLLIRKYFLPLARFLCLHPIESECAVGINAFSKEWEHIMNYVEQFGGDKQMLVFDYSKYDVRINSQMTTEVYSIYYELARRAGYSEEDLHIMKMMTADIVHPLLDWNGVLLMAFNMNTSGNNMTVITNSIAGALFVRMGFFSCFPREPNFRACVAGSTYGDDFIGSVHAQYRDFNFESYRDFLAEHNMKITLPSKTDDSAKFLPLEEADFLKRTSHYIPEIDTVVGRLDENSIFKSLHCNLKSKVALPHEVAAGCIETALHEWFAYGREHYEMRASQMREVCKSVNLPVPATNTTFDERVENWKEKYLVKAVVT